MKAGQAHDLSLPEQLIREYAPGKHFVDVGAMWGIHGAHAFHAEAAGASRALAVDIYPATEKFKARVTDESSSVEFIQGDINDAQTRGQIGACDVVFSFGVLYHTPNPLELLFNLRSICKETLLLGTMMIPEMTGLRNMAVFYPYLDARQRRIWQLDIGEQKAITGPYEPPEGYGNWFWGMTPSCIESALRCAGFQVERRFLRGFSGAFVCRIGEVSFAPVSGAWTLPGD